MQKESHVAAVGVSELVIPTEGWKRLGGVIEVI